MCPTCGVLLRNAYTGRHQDSMTPKLLHDMSAGHCGYCQAQRGPTWIARMAVGADIVARYILYKFLELLLIALLLALA